MYCYVVVWMVVRHLSGWWVARVFRLVTKLFRGIAMVLWIVSGVGDSEVS